MSAKYHHYHQGHEHHNRHNSFDDQGEHEEPEGFRLGLAFAALFELVIAVLPIFVIVDFIAQSEDTKRPENSMLSEEEFNRRLREQVERMYVFLGFEVVFAIAALATLIAAVAAARFPDAAWAAKWIQIAITTIAWGSALLGLVYIGAMTVGFVSKPSQVSRFLGIRINSDGLRLIFISYCCLVGMVSLMTLRFSF